MSSFGFRFGQVWTSRDEVLGAMSYQLDAQVAELHPERHAAVAGRIRELIGN